MRGFTLDTGALIGLEREDEKVIALLDRALSIDDALVHIPAGVLGQAFRDGDRQVKLARLLKHERTVIVPLDDRVARAAGMVLGACRADDVIDASVVICAGLHRQGVVTSDPDDLRRLDPDLPLAVV